MANFRALVLEQGADRKVSAAVQELPEDRLPAGDVTVQVEHSTLNYKDGLVLTTGGGLVKTWPHVGGIDLAGTVTASDNPGFKAGDRVEKGEVLAVVEGMKMQHAIRAGRAGRILQVLARQGELVDAEAILFDIGPA